MSLSILFDDATVSAMMTAWPTRPAGPNSVRNSRRLPGLRRSIQRRRLNRLGREAGQRSAAEKAAALHRLLDQAQIERAGRRALAHHGRQGHGNDHELLRSRR